VTTPSHIGQYRIVRKLGAGGMGVVFLGEHTLLGRRAAIKTLLPTVAANREVVERFFNEARATSSIVDPGVIQIFDFGYHVDGTAYIVMELLEGEALSARLDRLGKLPLCDAVRFGRQIAGSLAAAHARDIIHRDLKPENIFLVRDAEAQGGERTKIIDFGVCKVGAGEPGLTEVGAMIGTPVYMSPEQCRGTGAVDQRSDIYAFGCLMFHVLTGRPPFLGEASGDLIVAHLQTEPPAASQYLPELPAAVDALVLRCLAKAPDDRFPSMTEILAALGELAEQAEAAPPAATAPPMVPLGRGFRSMYDAGMNAALGLSSAGSAIGPGLRARLRFASPLPEPPPPPAVDEPEPPARRASVRAALACVLVVGVTLGFIVTPLVAGDRGHPGPGGRAPAALPVEGTAEATRGSALERAANAAAVGPSAAGERDAPVAGDGESSPAAATAVIAIPGERPRRAGAARGARDTSHVGPSATPATERDRGRSSPAASDARTSRSVTSPAELPAPRRAPAPPELPAAAPARAPAPQDPAASPAFASTSSAASSATSPSPPARPAAASSPPPPPTTEDLYDTR
jgi:tRNA A-37 threonylcarbamoyl transferase component Bud32